METIPTKKVLIKNIQWDSKWIDSKSELVTELNADLPTKLIVSMPENIWKNEDSQEFKDYIDKAIKDFEEEHGRAINPGFTVDVDYVEESSFSRQGFPDIEKDFAEEYLEDSLEEKLRRQSFSPSRSRTTSTYIIDDFFRSNKTALRKVLSLHPNDFNEFMAQMYEEYQISQRRSPFRY
jgi:hypothetical protein